MNCLKCHKPMNEHTSNGVLVMDCNDTQCDLYKITRTPDYFETHTLEEVEREFANGIERNRQMHQNVTVATYVYVVMTDDGKIEFDDLDSAIDYSDPNAHWEESTMMLGMFKSDTGLRIYRQEV